MLDGGAFRGTILRSGPLPDVGLCYQFYPTGFISWGPIRTYQFRAGKKSAKPLAPLGRRLQGRLAFCDPCQGSGTAVIGARRRQWNSGVQNLDRCRKHRQSDSGNPELDGCRHQDWGRKLGAYTGQSTSIKLFPRRGGCGQHTSNQPPRDAGLAFGTRALETRV